MKLFFSPLACSLAPRIALYEARVQVTYLHVDTKTKRLADGADYRDTHPLGLVPALELSDGELLTENSAILEYIADRFPEADLAPTDVQGRVRLRQALSFVATELHKGVYTPLLDRRAPQPVKAYALEKAESRLGWLSSRLAGRDFLLDRFSVADAYAFTILHWSRATPIDLGAYPVLSAYLWSMLSRSCIARAVADEKPLYLAETQREAY